VSRASARDQRHSHDGADHGREQDHERQLLPTEPRTDRGEQLEVAEAHAFLTGDELEQLIDRPEAEIARNGADDARVQVREQRLTTDRKRGEHETGP
jgi:hypothetical protein